MHWRRKAGCERAKRSVAGGAWAEAKREVRVIRHNLDMQSEVDGEHARTRAASDLNYSAARIQGRRPAAPRTVGPGAAAAPAGARITPWR